MGPAGGTRNSYCGREKGKADVRSGNLLQAANESGLNTRIYYGVVTVREAHGGKGISNVVEIERKHKVLLD